MALGFLGGLRVLPKYRSTELLHPTLCEESANETFKSLIKGLGDRAWGVGFIGFGG